MYLNVISFKNTRTLSFQTKVPFSIDQINDNWNVVTDESSGQVISFKGTEVTTIASIPVDEQPAKDVNRKKPVDLGKFSINKVTE